MKSGASPGLSSRGFSPLKHLFTVVLELAPEVSNLSQTFLPRPMVLWGLGPTGLASLPHLLVSQLPGSLSQDLFSHRLKIGLGFEVSSLSLSSLLPVPASLLLDSKLLCSSPFTKVRSHV